jgi:hypothetical protein
MERVYDEDFNVIAYVTKKLKSYFNTDAKVCGLCMYPYELVRVRRIYSRIPNISKTSTTAIVHVKHDHRYPNAKPMLILKRWISDNEVEKFMQMSYNELIKELES